MTTAVCGGTPNLRVVMVSLHTSPLAQAGRGDAGGLNVYVNALSRSLREAGLSVDIITTGPGADAMTSLPDGRRVHTLHATEECLQDKNRLVGYSQSIASRAVRSLMSADQAPVTTIHSHYWLSGLAALEMSQSLDSPLIHTMHTIGAVKKELDPSSTEDPRRDEAEARIAARADRLTANTWREAADLQRLFGVQENRITLVKPGVDLGVFYPPADPDPRVNLEGRALQLTFAGRLQPHKGPQIAIEAVGIFRRMMPETPVCLAIAGQQSGQDAIDIESLATAHGVADVLRTMAPLPHQQLANLFRSSDAVLVPSYSESFGLVALEAMASGTPVLAHNVGGLSELVRHKRTGRLLDTLDPHTWAEMIRWIALHRKAWQRYSTTAAAVAHEYSWDSTATAALEIYREFAPATV